MAMLSGLHHVGVVVQDLEASVAWYVDNLGFERRFAYDWPGVQAAFVEREGLRIEFFENEDAAPMAAARRQSDSNLRIGGINHFAIEVSDLDSALAALSAKGVSIVSPPRAVPNSGGSRFAFVHDNQQMLIELFEEGSAFAEVAK